VLEAERAQELAKETASHPQQKFATEPPQQQRMDPVEQFEQMIAHLPERVRDWYRVDPQFLDERAAQIQYAHHVVRRELGEEFTDPYYDRMEHALGLRHVAPQPEPQPLPERQRASTPARQNGPPVSAPPTRDSYSMSTGRPQGGPTQLSGEERQLAKTLGLTDDQYRKGKERMLREKAGGFHQHDWWQAICYSIADADPAHADGAGDGSDARHDGNRNGPSLVAAGRAEETGLTQQQGES
jgi:hypothetical protein